MDVRNEPEGTAASKRGCLLLMLAGIAFIVLVFGIIIYVISRPQTSDIQRNEQAAIDACWARANDEATARTSRAFAADSCREMEKQYKIKFGDRQP